MLVRKSTSTSSDISCGSHVLSCLRSLSPRLVLDHAARCEELSCWKMVSLSGEHAQGVSVFKQANVMFSTQLDFEAKLSTCRKPKVKDSNFVYLVLDSIGRN